jgi:hypothetical protein
MLAGLAFICCFGGTCREGGSGVTPPPGQSLGAPARTDGGPVAAPGPSSPPAAGEEKYCASRSSKVFHLCTCKLVARIKPENLVKFRTREEAAGTGRKPCKMCAP